MTGLGSISDSLIREENSSVSIRRGGCGQADSVLWRKEKFLPLPEI
jgi:hypothetical protein